MSVALPLAMSGAQTGFGIYQAIKGAKKLNNTDRSTYKIPDEIIQNLNAAERMALEGMPDAQKQAYLQNLQRSSQFALRGLSDRRAGVGAIANVQSQLDMGAMNLLGMDAAQRQENRRLAMGARTQMAQYRDKAFELNELQPFIDDRAEAQALIGGGIQNIFGGMDMGAGALQSQQNTNMWKEYLNR